MSLSKFEIRLGKCYVYASNPNAELPEEYRVIYEQITRAIDDMSCGETVRVVMLLRYRYGNKFTSIAKKLGITYQWVYELHKSGVSYLEKHLSL